MKQDIKLSDLPENFILRDSGQYGHDNLYWICRPGVQIKKRYDSDDVEYIFYDKNYQPIKGMYTNGKICKVYKKRIIKVSYNHDPRYIFHNCEKIDLSKFGLQGNGYLVEDTSAMGADFVSVVKFLTPLFYIKYLFVYKGEKMEEVEDQRWVYRIKPIK